MRLIRFAPLAALTVIFAGACAPQGKDQGVAPVGLANPASVHCGKAGGRSEIRTQADGGQYGVCVFDDGRQCEEWALLRDNRCVAPS